MLHTRLWVLFGIEHPVLNAPMGGGDAPARLAVADRRGVDAVLMLGAEGVWIGTRFLATSDAFVDRWQDRERDLQSWVAEQRDAYRRLDDVGETAVWAGEAASFVTATEGAGYVVRSLVSEATTVLQERPSQVTRVL